MHRPQNRGNVTYYCKKIYENGKCNKLSALNDSGSSEQGTKFCYESDSLMHPLLKQRPRTEFYSVIQYFVLMLTCLKGTKQNTSKNSI